MTPTRPAILAVCLLSACSFDPLEPAEPPLPSGATIARADSGDATKISGILVSPAAIHTGDLVRLEAAASVARASSTGSRAYFYYWDACAGEFAEDAEDHGPVRTWIAPEEPGTYAITVSEVNHDGSFDGMSSVVLDLCVAPPGTDSCARESLVAPELRSLQADPDIFEQGCGPGCAPVVTANVWMDPAASEPLEFRWLAARGAISGSGPRVTWSLPSVGCCTETFTISVSVCGPDGGAATGFTRATVIPE